MDTLVSIEAYKKAESEVAKLEDSDRIELLSGTDTEYIVDGELRSALSASAGVKQAVRVSSCARQDRV